MKIISLQKNLKNSLSATSHIAQRNTSLPILNNILISAKDGVIKLVSTNLEIGITSNLRGKIEEEGSFTVDAKTFSEYSSLLDNDKVLLNIDNENLKIECGSYNTKIKGISAEEFPLIPQIERVDGIKIPAQKLKQALSQIVFSVSSDENRAELSGVLFSFKENKLLIVGTDSYRLAEKEISISSGVGDYKMIIPAKTIQELIRIISIDQDTEEVGDSIMLYTSDNQCLFVFGGIELVSRLIDGHYPDYKQIIPSKHRCKAIVPKDELVRAVKAAAIFSRTGINDIVLSFSGNNLKIDSASGQTGEQSSVILSNISGDESNITLNYKYVLDGLMVMAGDEIIFEVVDDQTPCIIKDTKDEAYTYLVMPIKK